MMLCHQRDDPAKRMLVLMEEWAWSNACNWWPRDGPTRLMLHSEVMNLHTDAVSENHQEWCLMSYKARSGEQRISLKCLTNASPHWINKYLRFSSLRVYSGCDFVCVSKCSVHIISLFIIYIYTKDRYILKRNGCTLPKRCFKNKKIKEENWCVYGNRTRLRLNC